jgi:hypothetical protein
MTNYLNRTLPVALFIAATAATTAYAQEGGSASREQDNQAAYTATVQEGRASTSALDTWAARNGETAIRVQEQRAANES